jgi:hypothetical protein
METLELRKTVLEYVNQADEHLLRMVKKIMDNYRENVEPDWWDELSEEEQKEIEEGLAELDRGEYISNEEVMKYFDKWH